MCMHSPPTETDGPLGDVCENKCLPSYVCMYPNPKPTLILASQVMGQASKNKCPPSYVSCMVVVV